MSDMQDAGAKGDATSGFCGSAYANESNPRGAVASHFEIEEATRPHASQELPPEVRGRWIADERVEGASQDCIGSE